MKKILQINFDIKSCYVYYKLHLHFNSIKGYESKLCVFKDTNGATKNVIVANLFKLKLFRCLSKFFNSLYLNITTHGYKIKQYRKDFPLFTFNNIGYNFDKEITQYDPDVIIFHGMNSSIVSINKIANLAEQKKIFVIYRLYDLNFITGGCHYPINANCNKYIESCGKCVNLNSSSSNDGAHYLQLKKVKLYSGKGFQFVVPSEWFSKVLSFASVLKGTSYSVNVIHNGIDTSFVPIEAKASIKEKYNLSRNFKYVLTGAFNNIIKGSDILEELVVRCKQELPQIKFILFGSFVLNYSNVINLGYVPNETLFELYNAADCFISTSRMETFGNTIVESLLCSTPVVAFNATAMPELIIHKKYGYLVKAYDVEDFIQGIGYVLENNLELRMMIKNEFDRNKFSVNRSMRKYVDLIDEYFAEK